MPCTSSVLELEVCMEEVVIRAVQDGLCPPGKQVGWWYVRALCVERSAAGGASVVQVVHT